MRIVVTGGAGFIGSAVMELGRKRGHEMVSFDRSQGYDILGPLYPIEGDAVIHLAGVLGTAELFDSPDEAIQVNIVGSHRVMQRCIEVGAQYVGILMPDIFPSIYTATKIATARLATALHYSRGLRVNHVRAYNAFGAGQKYGHGHPQKIVPTFAVHAWHRHPLPIWGDGLQGVDLIHTSDLARMLLDAATLPGDDLIFDGGTGQELTVVQVARMVAQAAGWDEPVFDHRPMRDGERPSYEIQAKGEGWDLLDWVPELRMSDLYEAVESYRGTPLED